MQWSDVQQLISEGEGSRVDFKEIAFFTEDKDEIAADLASFANRYGGCILVGVNDAGTIEGGSIRKNDGQLRILDIANNKCSPPVEVSFDYFNNPSGDVLAINIQKRKGIPHAVVERDSAEIKRRKYYIRTENRKKLIDDALLAYMFSHTDDPGTSATYSIMMWYVRSDFNFSAVHFPEYMSFVYPYIQSINGGNGAYLKEAEPDRVRQLMLEILPYGLLTHMSWRLGASWRTDTFKNTYLSSKAHTPDQLVDIIDSRAFLTDIVQILPKLSLDFHQILSQSFIGLKVPKGTDIDVEVKRGASMAEQYSLLRFRHPKFEVMVRFIPIMWAASIPHPVADKLFMDILEMQEKFATVSFRIDVQTKFRFPDEPDDMFDYHYAFAQAVLKMLNEQWNWQQEVEKLKVGKIDQIYKILKEIRLTLENRKKPAENEEEVASS